MSCTSGFGICGCYATSDPSEILRRSSGPIAYHGFTAFEEPDFDGTYQVDATGGSGSWTSGGIIAPGHWVRIEFLDIPGAVARIDIRRNDSEFTLLSPPLPSSIGNFWASGETDYVVGDVVSVGNTSAGGIKYTCVLDTSGPVTYSTSPAALLAGWSSAFTALSTGQVVSRIDPLGYDATTYWQAITTVSSDPGDPSLSASFVSVGAGVPVNGYRIGYFVLGGAGTPTNHYVTPWTTLGGNSPSSYRPGGTAFSGTDPLSSSAEFSSYLRFLPFDRRAPNNFCVGPPADYETYPQRYLRWTATTEVTAETGETATVVLEYAMSSATGAITLLSSTGTGQTIPLPAIPSLPANCIDATLLSNTLKVDRCAFPFLPYRELVESTSQFAAYGTARPGCSPTAFSQIGWDASNDAALALLDISITEDTFDATYETSVPWFQYGNQQQLPVVAGGPCTFVGSPTAVEQANWRITVHQTVVLSEVWSETDWVLLLQSTAAARPWALAGTGTVTVTQMSKAPWNDWQSNQTTLIGSLVDLRVTGFATAKAERTQCGSGTDCTTLTPPEELLADAVPTITTVTPDVGCVP